MWTESQRAELARISESDRQAAAWIARRVADRRYTAMLDTDEDGRDWEYAPLLGMFLWRGGRVPSAVVRAQLGRSLTSLENEARVLSLDRMVPARDWATRMTDVVKGSALIAGAYAVGGWTLLDPAMADIEASIHEELGYLDKFAAALTAGQIPRDGRFIRRAMLYGGAGWALYMLLRSRRARALAYHEERNVLDPGAEHCGGCMAETAKGWQPIGSLTPIGDRQCLSRCRCYLEYRNRAGEAAT